MVALLVIITGVICLIVDWITKDKHPAQMPTCYLRSNTTYQHTLKPEHTIESFRLREGFYFHPGHTWAFCEGPHRVRIGIDDFACQLLAPITHITLPESGHTFAQGMATLRVHRPHHDVILPIPIGGQIIARNMPLCHTPNKLTEDPFGHWLLIVQTDTLQTQLANLLSNDLIFVWMTHEATRLRIRKRLDLPLDTEFYQAFFRGASLCYQP